MSAGRTYVLELSERIAKSWWIPIQRAGFIVKLAPIEWAADVPRMTPEAAELYDIRETHSEGIVICPSMLCQFDIRGESPLIPTEDEYENLLDRAFVAREGCALVFLKRMKTCSGPARRYCIEIEGCDPPKNNV